MTTLDLVQRVRIIASDRAVSEFSSAAPITSFACAQFAAWSMQAYCTVADPDIKKAAAYGICIGLALFTAGFYRTLRNYS